MTALRSASRQARDALSEQENSVFEGRVSADTMSKIAEELYAVGQLLVAQPRLRRTLGDPATASEARVGLLENLVAGKIGKQALELAEKIVSQRLTDDAQVSATVDAFLAGLESHDVAKAATGE